MRTIYDFVETEHELFNVDDDDDSSDSSYCTTDSEEFNTFDECLNSAIEKDLMNESNDNSIRDHSHVRKKPKLVEKRPVVFVRFNTKRGKPKPVTLRALLDSGASSSLVVKKHVSKLKQYKPNVGNSFTTPAGVFKTAGTIKGEFIMPELHDNKMIEWKLHVAQGLGAYDMIIGRDILEGLGIDIMFSSQTISWEDVDIPFKDMDATELDSFFIREPDVVRDTKDRLANVMANDYHKADLAEVAKSQTQLTKEEQALLEQLLSRHSALFDGTLGAWTHDDVKLKVKEGAKPYHARSFPVPKIHYDKLKTEVERLCKIGVLKRVNRSEWAAPAFIVPKKDGKIRFVSDFRELNKRIERHPYPVPNIKDMLLNLEGFQYATALDLNMGYYHVRLDPDSRKLCTIILPFGKFEYQRLPQGVCNGPDIFQEKIAELFDGMDFVRAYIDDLLVLTKGDFEDHLEKLEEVLLRLEEAGLKVNAPKSFFARSEIEYLGYWITREGIKPMPKKVEAFLKLAPPKNKKELRRFIGIVNYYRDMWIRRSHVLAPLASLTSKKAKWKWEQQHEDAFQQAKKIITREVMLAYPDFSKPFEIHTDASHFQLGAVISQDGKPIAFYSRKLNDAQTRYTTTERELLSIVETLKEFKNILLGHQLIVYTDHKNLTCKNFNTERVMRWRLVLEEFGPELRYIKGENNIVADALSRLDMMSTEEFEDKYDEVNLAECFAAQIFPKEFPCAYEQLEHEQKKDKDLQKEFQKNDLYTKEEFKHSDSTFSLITRKDKIVVPKSLQKKTVEWYHGVLMHPGETRTELTIGQHFYWPNMRKTVKDVCSKCGICQLTKKQHTKYGLLPPKNPEVIPWHTVCVDLIGPYKIGKPGKDGKPGRYEIKLMALTMIDPATGWFDIVEIPSKSADVVANAFEQTWLTSYPRPTECVLDRGREFMAEFTKLLKDDYGITKKPITTRNPQANAIVERAHKTIHNLIASKQIKDKRSLTGGDWKGILSAVRFAMRATVHTTTQATPMQLVYGRDAILNVSFEADWQYIKQRKQHRILQNNKRENDKRLPHTYSVGDKVRVLQDYNRKYGKDEYSGPWTVSRVNDNGTLKLKRDATTVNAGGGAVYQTWNVRNLCPYST